MMAYRLTNLGCDQQVNLSVARTVGNGNVCDSLKIHVGEPPPERLGNTVPVCIRGVLDLPEHEVEQVFSLEHKSFFHIAVAAES